MVFNKVQTFVFEFSLMKAICDAGRFCVVMLLSVTVCIFRA